MASKKAFPRKNEKNSSPEQDLIINAGKNKDGLFIQMKSHGIASIAVIFSITVVSVLLLMLIL